MWILAAIASALFLGVYDIFKKKSVNHNAVLPVLLCSSTFAALLFVPLVIISAASPESLLPEWRIPFSGWEVQRLIMLKSGIVLSSWLFSFYAIKHLPLSIASPIRSTAPLWTLMGALVVFNESLNVVQWAGLLVSLVFFYVFSLAGKKEGFSFRTNKWVLFMIIATLLGSVSGLYDKYLLAHQNRLEVQAWFSFWLVLFLLPIVAIVWYPQRQKTDAFVWRWTIPLIGLFLSIADFLYFYALSHPQSSIAIISTVRRSNVVVSFVAGALLFHEKNLWRKGLLLTGIMLGIFIMYMGS